MRDLNLGPDTAKLIERFNTLDKDQRTVDRKAEEFYSLCLVMSKMLERWNTVAWCWPDACPATICGGPHVKVRYQHDNMGQKNIPVEIIEPYNKIGETFPDVPYTISRP